MNIAEAPFFAAAIARLRPSLVWAYNGYAFEAAVSVAVQRRTGCTVVLEIEDWPTARRRGLNPKPWIDAFFFQTLLQKADLVTFVNEHVRARSGVPEAKQFLLPGAISPVLLRTRCVRPFSRETFALGYFGSLSKEKGCEVLLELSRRMPNAWRLIVTGSGPLLREFEALGRTRPGLVEFIPDASEEILYDAMCRSDAIINPHTPIDRMGNGIFPFKVFEAIATHRLLITTRLPACGLELDSAVLQFDGGLDSLLGCLSTAQDFYRKNSAAVDHLARTVKSLYAEEALHNRLRQRLPVLEGENRDVNSHDRKRRFIPSSH